MVLRESAGAALLVTPPSRNASFSLSAQVMFVLVTSNCYWKLLIIHYIDIISVLRCHLYCSFVSF